MFCPFLLTLRGRRDVRVPSDEHKDFFRCLSTNPVPSLILIVFQKPNVSDPIFRRPFDVKEIFWSHCGSVAKCKWRLPYFMVEGTPDTAIEVSIDARQSGEEYD
jgi:hypothetical protein